MSLERRGKSPFINRGQQCSVKNCLKQAFCKTFCTMHYARLIKSGDPNLNLSGRYVGKRNICIIDGVGVVEGYGYCHKHYKAYKKYGDPLIKKRLNYGNHRYTKEGYTLIYLPKWSSARKDGYILEHRLIMEKKLGRSLIKVEVVHHKDGIRDNNVESNLELLTIKTHYKGPQILLCPHCNKACGH